jgi:two-component system chemotaxis response regulator CheB
MAMVGPGHSRPSAEKAVRQEKKKVLIVDDSKTIRDILCRIIQQDPQLEVVGQAENPLRAESMLTTLKPDVITLDIHMPLMTGVEWLKTLLPKHPIPVVMVTSLGFEEGNEVFQALSLGAIDYIQKPALNEIAQFGPIICEKIANASRAKIRFGHKRSVPHVSPIAEVDYAKDLVVAIGASTGGTEALREVLEAMPKNIPPILIVQHIPEVFSLAFAKRLHSLCPFDVKEAESGDAIHSNRVLIAPGGKQMRVVKKSSGLFVEINDDPPVSRHKPSVDYLFNSVADIIGNKAVGVILTGMGADGAAGLLKMKERGAVTFSQNEASCVVYGMPKAAWERGASMQQISLENIAAKIVEVTRTGAVLKKKIG